MGSSAIRMCACIPESMEDICHEGMEPALPIKDLPYMDHGGAYARGIESPFYKIQLLFYVSNLFFGRF